MIFHFRVFPRETNDRIFQKIKKQHIWPILVILGRQFFF